MIDERLDVVGCHAISRYTVGCRQRKTRNTSTAIDQ